MITILEKNPKATIFCFFLLLLLPGIHTIDISIMEGRLFVSAREMIANGNWLFPTFNGEPRYEKPPLPTWICAMFGSVLGLKIWVLRLPNILMVYLLCIYFYAFVQKLNIRKEYALQYSLILLSSLYVFVIPFEAPWDIYTHTFMFISIYYQYCFFQGDNHKIRNVILAILFMNFSVLSKGPIGLYALYLPFIISYLIVNKQNLWKSIGFFVMLLITGSVLGLAWYYYIKTNDTIAFEKIASKETSNWHSYNTKPFYYYWSFIIQSGPWTLVAFTGIILPILSKKTSVNKNYLLGILWVFSTVTLLSLIPEKKSRYLMPALIPLALLIGETFKNILQNQTNNLGKKMITSHYLLIILICLLSPVVTYFFLTEYRDRIDLVKTISPLCILVLVLAYLLIKELLQKKQKKLFYYCLLTITSLTAFVKIYLSDINYNASYAPMDKSYINTNLPIYSFGIIAPEILWHYGDKIPIINGYENIPKDKSFQLLIRDDMHRHYTKTILKEKNKELLHTFNQSKYKDQRRLRRQFYLISK